MKELVFVIIFYFSLCCDARGISTVIGKLSNLLTTDPDAKRNVSQLISSKGYPVEEHTVETKDGYILTLIRIPHGRDSQSENKEVVLLVHGDFTDAGQWVLNFPNQSLGFILPDNGYDTWLLNNRGCRYSKKHIQYSTHEYRFWNFSFDELGQYDLPDTIDYILETTDEDDLHVIGHSRGCSQTFAMFSEMPDYNDKVKLFVAMAPATFMGHMTSPVKVMAPVSDELAAVIDLVTAGEFTPDNEVVRRIRSEFCMAGPELCEFLIFAFGGEDKAQFNETRVGVYAAHFPSPTSTRSPNHYAQLIRSMKFRKYDFGLEDNLKYYHQEEPPDYDLTRTKIPVALFWSDNDALVDPRDIAILRKHLNSVVFDYRVPDPYGHFDFIIAINAPSVLYKPVLEILAKY